jgi:hypothetical protein
MRRAVGEDPDDREFDFEELRFIQGFDFDQIRIEADEIARTKTRTCRQCR